MGSWTLRIISLITDQILLKELPRYMKEVLAARGWEWGWNPCGLFVNIHHAYRTVLVNGGGLEISYQRRTNFSTSILRRLSRR